MRFNPRIIHDEEETCGMFATDVDERAFEESLPDGFAELAAQLGEDADMLHQRFPPETTEHAAVNHSPRQTQPQRARGIARRAAAWTGAVAAFAGVALIGWMAALHHHSVTPAQPSFAKSPASGPAPTQVVTIPSSVAAEERISRPAPVTRVAFAPSSDGRVSPAEAAGSNAAVDAPAVPGFLKDVSAPELEALYDLWEQDGPSEMKISI